MFEQINLLIHKAQNQRLRPELENLREKYNYHKLDNYYRFLYYLVEEFKPAVSLEIGVDFGVGSRHMLEAALQYDGLVIGVDIQEKQNCEIQVACQSPNYLFLKVSSTSDELKRILESAGPLGLVFQDSSHRYLESKQEWEMISPYCKPGAFWICDDITPAFYDPNHDPPGKGMMQYFEEIPRPHKILYQNILHFGNVQGVVIV